MACLHHKWCGCVLAVSHIMYFPGGFCCLPCGFHLPECPPMVGPPWLQRLSSDLTVLNQRILDLIAIYLIEQAWFLKGHLILQQCVVSGGDIGLLCAAVYPRQCVLLCTRSSHITHEWQSWGRRWSDESSVSLKKRRKNDQIFTSLRLRTSSPNLIHNCQLFSVVNILAMWFFSSLTLLVGWHGVCNPAYSCACPKPG